MCKQRISISGLTFVELLVALVLSMFIVSAVSIAFITANKNVKLQNALVQIQESSTKAFYFLKKNIQPNILIKGSDEFIQIDKTSALAASVYQHTPQSLVVADKPNFHKNDSLIISDYRQHEILKVINVIKEKNLQRLFLENKLVNAYLPQAEVTKVETINFYVRKTNRVDQWNHPVYALYSEKSGHRNEELVEGITAIKFLFAVAMNHMLVTKTAGEVADWKKVKGVEITLHVTSISDYPLQKVLHSYVALH